MVQASRTKLTLAGIIVAAGAVVGYAQATATPVNEAPNPYQTIPNFFKLPEGRNWGSTSAVDIDKDGKTIWVAERCGGNSGCMANPTWDPILHFDETGKVIKSFGANMIVSPHGIYVDRDGNIWVTDYQDNGAQMARGAAGGADAGGGGGRGAGRGAGAGAGAGAAGGADAAPARGAGRGPAAFPNPAATKGHQVWKFSPDGKVLMTIGRAGGAAAPECCRAPNDVIVAPNGDIWVSQGHGGGNDALFKMDRTGKIIKSWFKTGAGPGEFNQPHSLAFDSQGRLFIGDRANNRIQIFDQEGNFIAEWAQFSRPSGVFIDKNDMLYSADSESGSINPAHGAWKRGIRIGSAKDGKVTAFIPDPLPTCAQGQQAGNPPTCGSGTWVAEGVAADAAGNVYGAEVGPRTVTKHLKK